MPNQTSAKRAASPDEQESPPHKKALPSLSFLLQSLPSSHVLQIPNEQRLDTVLPLIHHHLNAQRAHIALPTYSHCPALDSTALTLSDLAVQASRPRAASNSNSDSDSVGLPASNDTQQTPSEAPNQLPPETNPYFDPTSPQFDPWHEVYLPPVHEFFEEWVRLSALPSRPGILPPISERALSLRSEERKSVIRLSDIKTGSCDLQGIPWATLGTTAEIAHRLRKNSNRPHHDVANSPVPAPQPTAHSEIRLDRFRFKQTTTTHIVPRVHHQLRYLFSAPSSAFHFYTSGSLIYRASPGVPDPVPILDITTQTKSTTSAWHPLDAPSNHPSAFCSLATTTALIISGTWTGHYAIQSLSAPLSTPWTLSAVPNAQGTYVNHISLSRARRTRAPTACLATNNRTLNTLDCTTNTFTTHHALSFNPNATAPSPDSRLRLVVGDTLSPVILDAETGHVTVTLPPHADWGFSCAWSDDGQWLATGNQDGRVQIFDARRWDRAVSVFATEMGGAAVLDFSKGVGESGGRVLLVAEPVDRCHLVGVGGGVEGRVWTERFLGDVTGAGFVGGGDGGGGEGGGGDGGFVVACGDPDFGGVMEWERVVGAGGDAGRDQGRF